MRWFVVLASLVLACGDNVLPPGPELATTAELVIVAHPADELLFMQPDLLEAVQRGTGVTAVYLSADATQADPGVLAAYAHAAGGSDWQCGAITIVADPAFHCRLAGQNVSLVFLAEPEVPTLTRIIRVTDPGIVRTLEVTGTHGDDAAGHVIAGQKTVRALAATNRNVALLSYRGENTAHEPPNKLTAIYGASVAMLSRYEACATGCAACGDACTAIDQQHVDWLLRGYAVGFRRTAGGRLRSNNQCVLLDLTLGACDAAPVWTLDDAGELRNDLTCITVGASGQPTPGRCVGGIDHRWYVDDDGHVMSAVNGVRCLAAGAGVAQIDDCIANPVWEFTPPTVSTPRTSVGITATGRSVRLGDLTGDRRADLCAVENNMLLCAPGNGAGAFTAAVRIDAPSAPLAIDPRSLVLGDVDGDDHLDACGRDDAGILCATAASTYQAVRWTGAFDAAVALPTTSSSLMAIDADANAPAELCAATQRGLTCTAKLAPVAEPLRSTWPAADAIVFFADLDGDAQADWCAATDAGPACAVWAEHDLTTDGAPWGYARSGIVDVTAATTATVATGDIDHDHHDDLCSLRDDRVVCARSLGRRFGPRLTLAIIPNQTTGSALWLGDLDSDGRVDACVESGPDIVCARQP